MIYIKKAYFTAFIFLFFLSSNTKSQQTFYNVNTIQKIEVFFSQSNWDFQMDTAKIGKENYILADSVKINGYLMDSVGIKYKGNSSFDSTKIKNPLHIALDEFKNQSYQSYTDIKLSNCYEDPSMIREVLAYQILKNYMECPQSNFAKLFINGLYIGLYSNDESINKDFCSNHFNSSQNTFIKCNPIVNPGPTTKSNLLFISNDSNSYSNFYEIKSDYGWNDLVKLCDSVTNNQFSLPNVFNVDRLLWMLAFNSVLVNLDSYSGVFCQNYYLYKDNNNQYNPIVWDLNMAFGGFPFAGSGATGMGSLTIANMQQLPVNLHSSDVYWPLIKGIWNNTSLKKKYVAHIKTILIENFTNNSYLALATQLISLIDTAVQQDANKFFTYSQFQNAMTANVNVGNYTVPGISNLMNSRITYLQSTTEISNVQPVISLINANPSIPALYSNINITANVSGSISVYLHYRYSSDLKFNSILMFDDGLHNDGMANDHVFGATITMQSAKLEYYIYAENALTGIFSPERAEHEFYSVNANIPVLNSGDIVINEFLTSNSTGQTNEFGQYADWIELFNNTSNPIDLFGSYLSDNFSNKTKFSFPVNSIILPKSFLTIWADENNSSSSNIHTNFKLSVNGEVLILSTTNGIILDSLSFQTQTADISQGRCPNGTGSFVFLSQPTFNTSNCPNNIQISGFKTEKILVYPNPALNFVNIYNKEYKGDLLEIYDFTGMKILERFLKSENTQINIENWSNGMFIVKCNNQIVKLVVNK